MLQVSDPRVLQINLTGFLEKNTSLFVKVTGPPVVTAVANLIRYCVCPALHKPLVTAGAVDAAGERVQ